MSKFLKALENAERERAQAAQSAVPAESETEESPAPQAVATSIAEPAAPDAPPRERHDTASEPLPRPTPVERAPEPSRRMPEAEPPVQRPRTIAAPPTPIRPIEPPTDRRPADSAAPPRPLVYGAPVARAAQSARTLSTAFYHTAAPADVLEPGELDDHLVSLLHPTSFAAEQYRAVRLAIETYREERGTRVVGISSPGRGEGKTITALNLAGALAQAQDARVILVEADLRHPSVATYLGLGASRGLDGFLRDPLMAPEAAIERPAGVAFAVIPAGAVSSMPYELLKSPRMGALLDALRRDYDYVLVDTPPAMPFPDVAILRDLVDGFVVVVRANRTPREMLRDTVTALGRQRTLGVIFNEDDRTTTTTFVDSQPGPGWRRLFARSRVA